MMPPTPVILTCLLVMTYVAQTSQTKIVVSIPFPFISHVKYHTNVARILASKDHIVWVTIPTYLLGRGSLDTSGFHILPYDTLPHLEQTVQNALSGCYFEGKQDECSEFLRICGNVFDSLLKNESFISTIEEKYPDLIVIDNLPMFYAMSIIPYRLGVPFAFLGSAYYAPTLRVPFSPAEVPITIFPYNNNMTFPQRLQNTFYYMFPSVHKPPFPVDSVSLYAPEMMSLPLDEIVKQAEIFLVEQDHVLDYPKPTLPNVKLIGGTATGPAKPLPPEFQSFMDSAKEGVVIVSFGSYVLDLPKHISDKILQVLLQLPMKSVFRFNLTSPDPKKILTAPWIPQNDLLGHPHTKVFVSHCGNSGQYEALYHGVPIVATPLFGDQPYNAERARSKGFAEVLDLSTCTHQEMKSIILTVADEPQYEEAVMKYSRLFKELYGVPMETAAYWLEHVMEYGGEYMRSVGQQMPFYQYVLLDVFLFIVFVLTLIVGLVCILISTIRKCSQKRKVKTE